MSFVCVFFFFKQKTAYEMRISDWSSDVCSSDLPSRSGAGKAAEAAAASRWSAAVLAAASAAAFSAVSSAAARAAAAAAASSEEHTSELQSLMRISYAVFCLKKKKTLAYKSTTW